MTWTSPVVNVAFLPRVPSRCSLVLQKNIYTIRGFRLVP